MIHYRELSRPLRLAIAAPWCLLLGLAATAAAPAFRQLLVDPATAQPTTTVSLSGPSWTGTLDPARLPADPVAGKDTAPASVVSSGPVQSAYLFQTTSGGFIADDSGLYLAGLQIADSSGTLFAFNRVQTPVVYVQAVSFADDSRLYVEDGHLVWSDASGTEHTLVVAP